MTIHCITESGKAGLIIEVCDPGEPGDTPVYCAEFSGPGGSVHYFEYARTASETELEVLIELLVLALSERDADED